MARCLSQGAGLAPPRDPAINQARVTCCHVIGSKAQAFHHAGPEPFNQRVCRLDQVPGSGAPSFGFQIQRNGAFAPIHGRAGVFGGFFLVCSTVHHNHVRAHVGQHHPGKGAWANTGKFNNSQAVQGADGRLGEGAGVHGVGPG